MQQKHVLSALDEVTDSVTLRSQRMSPLTGRAAALHLADQRQEWAVLDRGFSNENAQLLHYLMVASSPKRTSQDFGQ